MKQHIRIMAALLVLVLTISLFAGCSKGGGDSSTGAAKNDYPVTVGNIKFTESPAAVVVASPSLADVILSIRYEIKLVGKTEACTQEALSVLPNVDNGGVVDVEKIKALSTQDRPVQLVLADTALPEEQNSALAEAGIKVLVIQPAATREQFEKLYTDVGSVLGGGKTGYERAQKAAQSVFYALDEVQRNIPSTNVVTTACYLYDTKGAVISGDMLGSKLMEYAGAINAVKDSTGGKVDIAVLLRSNPNYIFCKPGVKAQLMQDERFSKLRAVQNNNVYEMEPGLIEWQGQSIFDGVSFMAGTMYPELLSSSVSSVASSEGSDSSSESSSQDGASSSEEPVSSQSEASSAPPVVSSESPPVSSEEPVSSGFTVTAEPNPIPADVTLAYGDANEYVTAMQQRLYDLGHMYTEPSGIFDDMTLEGVYNFQYCNNFYTSNRMTPEMLSLLFSADAKAHPNKYQ